MQGRRRRNRIMKSFVFDLYNTLIDMRTDEHCDEAWAPVVELFLARGIKASGAKLCSEFDGLCKLMYDRAVGERVYVYPEIDCVNVMESVARRAGGKLSRADAETALKLMRKGSIKRMKLFDGTWELFDGLRSRGAKLYLLSNAQAAFTRDEIAEVGLADKFDGMKLSSECGCRKPDPAFFEMLFDEYGIDKADAVMVGDDMSTDIAGANAFGIRGIWAGGGAAAHANELYAEAERQ